MSVERMYVCMALILRDFGDRIISRVCVKPVSYARVLLSVLLAVRTLKHNITP